MRKNPKIIKNYKFCLNEIKYLQLLIFAKRDFFSRPAPLRLAQSLMSCRNGAVDISNPTPLARAIW